MKEKKITRESLLITQTFYYSQLFRKSVTFPHSSESKCYKLVFMKAGTKNFKEVTNLPKVL